ncbi:MAG: CYTH domain-containing protein [Cyanobacteriota bacterium]|jgi:adenylate cyclase
MALEIERRFLVRGEEWTSHVEWSAELRQGYLLCREDGLTARVRMREHSDASHQAWLTIKAQPDPGAPAAVRLEFEYPIPVDDASVLLRMAPWRVEKRRYGLVFPGGDWVVDVFHGANSPLVIAEVEIQHADDSLAIPSWCAQEVTGLHSLSNALLARNPFQQWPKADRQALWPAKPETPAHQA